MNREEDEDNYHPTPEDNLEWDLAQALRFQHEEGPRTSAISNLGQQGITPTNPRDAQIAALTQTVQVLLERVERREGQPDATFDLIVPTSLLGTSVTLAPTQKRIETTSINRYNGSSDLRIHLAKYNSYMTFVGVTNATKCCLFLLTLSDQVHMWYTSLAPSSMDIFEQLVRLILGHFSAMLPCPTTN